MINGYELLTESERKFARWIEVKMPYLSYIFDFYRGSYLPEKVDLYMESASPGQKTMAKFALSVWLHNSSFEFDLFEAVKILDEENVEIINEWIKKPFWP